MSGNALIQRRQAQRISKAALARIAGLSYSYVCMLERGAAAPTLPVARKLAGALQCTVDDLWPIQEESHGT